jgi:hypothetical protein
MIRGGVGMLGVTVEGEILSPKDSYETDNGQRADAQTSEPVSLTYADIVRKGRGVMNCLNKLKMRGARAPLTFRN